MTGRLVLSLGMAGLLLAGCGIREPLRPAEGQALPPAPALSNRVQTTEQLLTVPTEFRPLRIDEPLTRSERRPIDRFDLPPPDVALEVSPVVGGEVEATSSELEERPDPDTKPPK